MDFKKIDTISAAEAGFEYTVKDLDDLDTDCKVKVVGVGSRIFKQAKAKIDKQEEIMQKRGKSMDEDVSNALWIELLAKCTLGWSGVEEDGKEIALSYDEAVRMYTAYPYFRNQILSAVHDLKAMLEGN